MMYTDSNAARLAPMGASRPLLGNIVRSSDRTSPEERVLSVWAAKNCAAKLLLSVSPSDGKRVSHCGYVPFEEWVALSARPDAGRAAFSGLKTCQSVWFCPVCSARISAGRRDELCELLASARRAGLVPCLLTLTFRHHFRDELSSILSGLKRAWDRFKQRQEWRRLQVQGHVTALEVTHGANGWHPHQHVLILLAAGTVDAVGLLSALASVWLTCLGAFGLTGNEAAFQVQDASAAGVYVGKFGAAEELALGKEKRGRRGGRSPWQLLQDARDGDKTAGRLWLVYALALKGRRQLVWSRGLKARFGIDEKPDEALPDPDGTGPMAVLRTWLGSGSWRQARRRRVALLFAARAGRSLDVVEQGPTDAERWRAVFGGEVIE